MFSDPIVEQARKLREEYAAKFGHDLDAICQDLMKRQVLSGRKLVKRSPKPAAQAIVVEGSRSDHK